MSSHESEACLYLVAFVADTVNPLCHLTFAVLGWHKTDIATLLAHTNPVFAATFRVLALTVWSLALV